MSDINERTITMNNDSNIALAITRFILVVMFCCFVLFVLANWDILRLVIRM